MKRTRVEKLAAVVREVSVSWKPEEAYERFVGRFSDWWPSNTHSIGGPRVKRVVFETKVGGRIYEEHLDGRRFQWGRVLELDPPRRVRFTFHPSRPENTAQTIEVVFHPQGPGTRVELIANGWESWGKGAERARRGYQMGWKLVLNLWAGRITTGMRLINAIGRIALVFQLARYGGRSGLINRADGEMERA
jgi:uncharacterized protein YndB with AHSA1/START domain